MSNRPKVLPAKKQSPQPSETNAAPQQSDPEALAKIERDQRAARAMACEKEIERVLARYGCHIESRPRYIPAQRKEPDGREYSVFELALEVQVVAHGAPAPAQPNT